MPTTDIITLMEKYLDGTATEDERREVLTWYRSVDHQEIIIPVDAMEEIDERRVRMLATLQAHVEAIRSPSTFNRVLTFRWAAAAVFLLLITGGFLLYHHRQLLPVAPVAGSSVHPLNDALPGHDGAILTLADGTTKVLDSLQGGVIATQGITAVTLKDGKIIYQPVADASMRNSSSGAIGVIAYNTMTTPRGRQYQLTLPDGTKVWLNAASSLHYPTAFNGPDRTVEMTGEAYFEVQHGKQPFRVKAAGQLIEDIGTHFNVNAYADEPAPVTTLLEGAVKVNRTTLKPGEQGLLRLDGSVKVSPGDVNKAVAWKDGSFSFTEAALPDVLRQLSRWYDVTVEYQGAVPTRRFSGDIGRTLSLSQVLRILTKTHIHYRIDNGTRLIILPE